MPIYLGKDCKQPKTLEEAVSLLVAGLDVSERAEIQSKESDPANCHFLFGMNLRNGWRLWDANTLTRHLRKRFRLFGCGDDNSGIILHCLWQEVRGLPWDAQRAAAKYRKHWRSQGINPLTGRKQPRKLSKS